VSTEAAEPRRATVGSEPIRSVPPQAVARGAVLPQRATASGTLRRLQEAALIGFAERGYYGLSTRDLARALRLQPSSVYAHVSAKEDLLFELVLIGHVEHNERLRRALLASDPDPRAQMEALVRAHVEMHATYPLLARVCNKELHALSPQNIERVMSVRLDSERMFVDVVQRGLESGVFGVADAWLAVAAIAAMGLRIAEWFEPDGPRTIREVADQYAMFALKLLS
jgi:AcrR family transcriptional regulator